MSQDSKSCVGCAACEQACPRKAIQMTEDSEGFLFPKVNPSLCTDCHLCERVCPMGEDQHENSEEGQQSFLTTTQLPEFYQRSATIGVCTMLAQQTIEKGGIVFGVTLDETTWKAQHIGITHADDVEAIRNSKYLQSQTKDTFSEARKALQQGQQVLYVGTPCQIAGLKAYLQRDYDNLLTVDLICHGTYSYKLIQKEVGYWEKRLKGKVSNFKFRSKRVYPYLKGGVINFDLIQGSKTSHHEIPGPYSPTYRCYAYSGDGKYHNLRLSCYTCPFRSRQRYGDLTVGDPWAVLSHYPQLFTPWHKQNGVSLVVCNNAKGNQAFAELGDIVQRLQIPNDEAFSQEALLPSTRTIPESRKQIYDGLEQQEYGKLVKAALGVDFEQLYADEQAKIRKEKRKNQIRRILLINRYKKLKNKLKSLRPGLEWWYTNCFLYNFPSKRFRNWCLRKMGMKMSQDVRIYSGFHIRHPRGITIEDGVSVGSNVLLDGRRGLLIKKSAVIGYGAIVWTLNHDYNDLNFIAKGAPVEIGERAWVCSHSIILPGITIGEGAVVASGAIVTKDVPPYAIVAGIPAKQIGTRDKKDYTYGYKLATDNLHFC